MELYKDEFARYVHGRLLTHKNREELKKRFFDVVFFALTTDQFNVIHSLCNCKTFEETAQWLSKREGKAINADAVRKRGERALETIKNRFDSALESLKDVKSDG